MTMNLSGSNNHKIVHVTSVHERYDERIFYKECVSLAKVGYDVTLLVADNKAPEVCNGVKIISADFKTKSRLDRMMFSSSVMFKYAMQLDAEIYHLHDPELLPAAKNLKKHGKKVVFDSHEDIPALILNKQWIPRYLRKPSSAAYSLYAKSILSRLDYVIGVTPHIVDKLRSVNSNVEMITNYPVTYNDIEDSRYTLKVNNVIVYTGGITAQWSHELILEAIKNLDVQYKLAGSADEKYIQKLRSLPSWVKVNYLGRIPHEKVAKVLRNSAVGMALLQYSPNSNGKEGTLGNTKLFEYMMAGLPVICTDFTLWKDIINKWHCGICVNPNDVNAIADAIHHIIEFPDVAEKMGNAGLLAVKTEFNWSVEEKKLLELYEKVINTTD